MIEQTEMVVMSMSKELSCNGILESVNDFIIIQFEPFQHSGWRYVSNYVDLSSEKCKINHIKLLFKLYLKFIIKFKEVKLPKFKGF